ncbi:hypothetical protein SUDANB182_06577 [Streptomyces sp. SudanB182_2057]
MVDAPDPGGAFAQVAGPVPGREEHGGGAVADGWAVAGAQRPYDVVALRDTSRELGVRVGRGVGPAAGADGGQRGFVGVPGIYECLGLEGGEGYGVGPQGGDVVGVELAGEDVPYRAG